MKLKKSLRLICKIIVVIILFTGVTLKAQSGSIVIIDSDFTNKSQIETNLGSNQLSLILNNSTNPWLQIRKALQQNTGVKTVHLFVNATSSSIQMGGSSFDVAAIKAENELGMLEGLYTGMPINLLLYNCTIGSKAEGVSLINLISQKSYFNIGACINCSSIFDTNFSFGYTSLNLPITTLPITQN